MSSESVLVAGAGGFFGVILSNACCAARKVGAVAALGPKEEEGRVKRGGEGVGRGEHSRKEAVEAREGGLERKKSAGLGTCSRTSVITTTSKRSSSRLAAK